jgi:hypothetical protein
LQDCDDVDWFREHHDRPEACSIPIKTLLFTNDTLFRDVFSMIKILQRFRNKKWLQNNLLIAK